MVRLVLVLVCLLPAFADAGAPKLDNGASASKAALAPPESVTGGVDHARRISARCAGEWGADYRMQLFCRRQQAESLAQLVALYQTVPQEILAHCAAQWGGHDGDYGPDWRMMLFCVQQQTAAAAQLR